MPYLNEPCLAVTEVWVEVAIVDAPLKWAMSSSDWGVGGGGYSRCPLDIYFVQQWLTCEWVATVDESSDWGVCGWVQWMRPWHEPCPAVIEMCVGRVAIADDPSDWGVCVGGYSGWSQCLRCGCRRLLWMPPLTWATSCIDWGGGWVATADDPSDWGVGVGGYSGCPP